MTGVPLAIWLSLVAAVPGAGQATIGSARAPSVTAEPTEVPVAYQLRWLDEVEPFLTDAERAAYLALGSSDLRTRFQREFWRARDPTGRTRLNEKKEEYLHHLVMARRDGGSPTDDRARLRMLLGPPDSTYRHGECRQPQEEPFRAGCVLAPTFELAAYEATAEREAVNVLVAAAGDGCRLVAPERQLRVQSSCVDARTRVLKLQIASALRARPSWSELIDLGLQAPPVRPWLDGFADEAASSSPVHPTLRLVARRPGEPGRGETGGGTEPVELEALLEIPIPDDWWRHPVPWRILYVRTDVLVGGRFVGTYDARRSVHERPGTSLEIPLQLAVDGSRDSTVVVHVEDEAAELFETAAFRVGPASAPELGASDDRDPARPTAGAGGPRPVAGSAALPLFEIAPLRGMRLGPTQVEVNSWGMAIARVELRLDGEIVATREAPPFVFEVDLGEVPRQRALAAAGFDRRGTLVAEDRWTLNPGGSRWQVRLTDLSSDRPGTLHLRGQVDVPSGATLERVELFEGDDLVASGTAPSLHYRRPETADEASGRAVVVARAVARLADGRTGSETLVVSRGPLEEVDVDLVEVFAAVRDRDGSPLTDLGMDEVRVLEEGRLQQLRHFERVENLPLNLLLLLDVSGTMKEEIVTAREGAVGFMERMIRQDDRAAVVVFAGAAYVAAPFTDDLETLREGSRSLAAWGSTALWDSAVASLYYLLGLEGRSALVLLSDGLDRSSHIDFAAALEFAERTGIAVYTIGLGLPQTGDPTRWKAGGRLRRLAERTGGRSFRLTDVRDVPEIYSRIETDLRSQYLLVYETRGGAAAESYRSIDVEVSRPGVTVEARPGYYPQPR